MINAVIVSTDTSHCLYTGFLLTNITGCARIPEAESQIGELVRYCNNLKYWSFPYCFYI